MFKYGYQRQCSYSQQDHAQCSDWPCILRAGEKSGALHFIHNSTILLLKSVLLAMTQFHYRKETNTISKILCKTLWSLFYPNYNHVILNHVARVGDVKTLPCFWHFSIQKECEKTKLWFLSRRFFQKTLILEESKENTLGWHCFPLGRICQSHATCKCN